MTIQEFQDLYFKNQLEIYNEYERDYLLDEYIYTNDTATIQDIYGDNLDILLRDLSDNNYKYYHDYFCLTAYGLESFDRPKAQEIINDLCNDILFKKWLEDYYI